MKNKSIRNAIYLGTLCTVAYFAVYIAKNILSTVTPQMLEAGYNEAYIGKASSLYYIFYAVGQLINGSIGDKIKARYMMSIGLGMAGITLFAFANFSLNLPDVSLIAYALTGFFLSMIYGPMTKVVSENVELVYATRCSLGYTISSYLGSPMAGILAATFVWQNAFMTSSIILVIMAIICFICFIFFEKKGIVKYNQFKISKENGNSIKLLIKRRIIKFTLIAMITGVVRTAVVFWMPTYLSQRLEFSSQSAASIFTVATLMITLTAFIAVFVYEKLKRNMDLTILIMFSLAALFFALVYFVSNPILNIIFLILAIMSNNASATMLWSRYCPSLCDTGMVSGATGFLDFASYSAASLSSALFANAVSGIGWGNLILIWFGLMAIGIIVALPKTKFKMSE